MLNVFFPLSFFHYIFMVLMCNYTLSNYFIFSLFFFLLSVLREQSRTVLPWCCSTAVTFRPQLLSILDSFKPV